MNRVRTAQVRQEVGNGVVGYGDLLHAFLVPEDRLVPLFTLNHRPAMVQNHSCAVSAA